MEHPPSPFPGPEAAGLPPKFAKEGITFDDVLLVPAESSITPGEVTTASHVTPKIELQVPIISAPMDSVTEGSMAIAMARLGGLGIVHRNLSTEDQVAEVDRVKRSQSGMITDPVTLPPDAPVTAALELMARFRISGVPITDGDGRLVGLLTNRDLRFVEVVDQPIDAVMRKPPLVTAPVGTTIEGAKDILWQHRIEKLPIVDDDGMLRGLITVKDIKKQTEFPHSTQDDRGRLRVGAAVGVGPEALERAEALVGAGVDVLVVDTSHGHNQGVLDMIKAVKGAWDIEVIGGNIATAEAAEALIAAGADTVKVGIGPGCFAAGTRVLMADGTYKPIEQVVAGDRVINMHGKPVDVVKAWCTGVREVMAVRHNASANEMVMTPDHQFFVGDDDSTPTSRSSGGTALLERASTSTGVWATIAEATSRALLAPAQFRFEVGGELIEILNGAAEDGGAFVSVEQMERRDLDIAVPVYDIEVDCPTHSFIAENVVVHNSICTTRVVAGVGVPQLTAVHDAAQAAASHGVPVISDGGIQLSGDIPKAIAAGASTVMLGSLLAGVDESPGEVVFHQGEQFKEYRGMGSIGAMKSRSYSKDRYFQAEVTDTDKLVPEGIEGRVAYKGPLTGVIFQLVGGLRTAMGYCGTPTVDELRERGHFVRITTAGLRESHPHDITITKEAPNYIR